MCPTKARLVLPHAHIRCLFFHFDHRRRSGPAIEKKVYLYTSSARTKTSTQLLFDLSIFILCYVLFFFLVPTVTFNVYKIFIYVISSVSVGCQLVQTFEVKSNAFIAPVYAN